MNFTCETIGLTEKELQDRVIDAITEDLLSSSAFDYESDSESLGNSNLQKRLVEIIKDTINDRITKVAEAHIIPNVQSIIDNVILHETNQWGEKKGKEFTFIEYMTDRAENYMKEMVDRDGKSKEEGGYGWSGKQSRMTYLINSKLQYSIFVAVKNALKGLNEQVAGGLEATIKQQMKDFQNKLKVTIK